MICGLDGDVGLRLRDVIEAANGLSWQGPFQGSPHGMVREVESAVCLLQGPSQFAGTLRELCSSSNDSGSGD
jgi:hypothetical protein